MISGLDLNATVDYTLKKDKNNPTIWKIGVIPSSFYNRLLTQLEGTSQIYSIVQAGLKGWDNFNIPYATEKRKIVGEEKEVVCLDLLDRIDQNIIAELAAKIIEINKSSEEEIKN